MRPRAMSYARATCTYCGGAHPRSQCQWPLVRKEGQTDDLPDARAE